MLDRKDGMITVDDGIRRLRLLDAKGKVWTQEMLLQVEEKAVSLIDQETKVRSSPSTCRHTCRSVRSTRLRGVKRFVRVTVAETIS